MANTRYTTKAEEEFYIVMLQHYKERLAALPHVKFLKRTVISHKKIITTKRIPTYEET